MITRGDDYPIHQTAQPVAVPANPSDRNHYERFFFDGYTRDGSSFFAVAGAVYPNRAIMDAAISIVHDGVQTNLRASRKMPADFLDIDVGPITISILEPMRRLRVSVAPNDSGLHGTVEFVARGPAVQEGPYVSRSAGRRSSYMRFTQHGGYAGSLTVGGASVDLTPDTCWGVRDRSWGTRGVGDPDPVGGQANARLAQLYPGPARQRQPLLFLWAPLNFPDRTVLWTVSRGMGDAYETGSISPADPAASPAHAAALGHTLQLAATDPHITSAVLQMDAHTIELQPLYHFSMTGIGYGHPEWGHGRWKGDLEVGHDSFKLADANFADRMHFHVQTLCRAKLDRTTDGIGVLEQIVSSYTPSPL